MRAIEAMRSRRTSVLRRSRAAAAGIGALLIGATAQEAAAQSGFDLPISDASAPPLTGDIEQVEKRAFWGAGRQRWFFAAMGEAGNFYVRTTAAVGYGKPHWSWIGVESSSSLSPNGGVEYGGVRLSSRGFDFRAGARYNFTFNQNFLVPRKSYTRDQTEEAVGERSRYVVMEAELTGGYPLLRGALFGVAGVYAIAGTPPGWNVFEGALKIVVEPPFVWRARLGYLARIDRWDMFRLGATAEILGNPHRGAVVVRAGPTVTVMITHHLEAFGTALMVLRSPDSLGFASAQFGELGFRYRWATGDRWPEFP
jgi:hypothetical protein